MTTTFLERPGAHGPIPGIDYHVALGYYPEAGGTVARWDTARWDTAGAKWVGVAPLDDVTCDVISVDTAEGRDQPLERFRPGTCTVVLNDPDGKYSPWSTAFDPSQYSAIRVGIDLVAWAEIGGTRYPRFRGIVDQITDGFDTDGSHTVTFQALDYLSLLAAYDGVEQPAQGDGELTGARISRILGSAAYQYPARLDPGTIGLQATTLAQNALDTVGLSTDTELGAVWADRDGVLVFRDRNGIVSDPDYTTVQAVFGDSDAVAGEICYTAITLASDTNKIKNIVSISNVGGTAVTRSDPTSVSLYQPRTFRRFDLIHVDAAQSVIIAQRHLDFYAYAANRVEQLSVDLATLSPAERVTMLELDTLWRIEVRRRATGFQVVAQLQIEGMAEQITASSWTMTLKTFSATAVFKVGRWDIDLWDHGLWGY